MRPHKPSDQPLPQHPRNLVRGLAATDPVMKKMVAQLQSLTSLGMDLLLEKAVEHCDDPKKFPLPTDPHAPEVELSHLLNKLGKVAFRSVRKKVEDRVGKKEPERKAHYGVFADIDLHSSAALQPRIEAKIRATAPKPMATEVAALSAKLAAASIGPTPRAAAAGTANLTLVSVHCVEKTREAFEGKDEIELLAFPANDNVAQPKVRLDLGKFEQGQTVQVNQLIASFDIEAAAQALSATFVLFEADIVDQENVAAQLILYLMKFVFLLGTAIWGILLLVTGAAALLAPWLVAVVVGMGLLAATATLWFNWLIDDPFEPGRTEFIPAFDPLVLDESFTLKMTQRSPFGALDRKGIYELLFRWEEGV